MSGKWREEEVRAFLIAVLAIVALLTTASLPAMANDHGIPQTVDELLKVYGIADEPADYVVAVDTSGSMMSRPPIYPKVRKAFADFTRVINDGDHLAVITFDTNPTLRFNGTLAAHNRGAAASALPKVARGARTDIGAAIDAALERMERPDAMPVQTLIFLTDGLIDAPGSAFERRGSKAWKKLTARAERLKSGHSLAVYGAGLGSGETDIEALRDVFPNAKIVSLPSDQLAAFFGEAVQSAKIERLRLPVTQELKRNVIQPVVSAGTLGDTTKLSLKFDSKLPNLGVTINLRGVTVADANGAPLRTTLVGGPTTMTVGPGRSSDPVEVHVKVPGLAKEVRIGQIPEERDFAVSIDAELEVEPTSVLVNQLAIETAPKLVDAGSVTSIRMHGIAYWMIGAALLTLVLVLLFFLWVYRRFFGIPKLRGGVQLRDGTTYWFRGREEKVPNSRLTFDGGGASVIFFTKRGQYTKPLSTRFPRLYVRRAEGVGAVKVMSYGLEEPLSEVGVVVGNTDQITVGSTQLTLVIDGK